MGVSAALALCSFMTSPASAFHEARMSFLVSAHLGQTLPVPDDFLFGKKWGSAALGTGAVVTWSFQPTSGSQVALSNFMPDGYADQVRQAFQTWSDVANISFVEVATGGQIKLLGRAIDGPGGTAGTGQYPGSGSSTITFDTGNAWALTQNSGGSDIYQTAVHEIGHAIGLLHPPGISAAMNHVIARAFTGLLPTDVAGVQAIYGPSATVDNSQYLPTNVSRLWVDPSSQVNVTLSIPGFLSVSQSTTISGTIDARIEGLASGVPTALTFYNGALSLADVSVTLANPALTGTATFQSVIADFFSKDWFGPSGHLTPIANGQFAVSANVVGLIGGLAAYQISIPIANVNTSGSLTFAQGENVGPVTFAPTSSDLLGSVHAQGSNLDLTIPFVVQSSISAPAGGISIPLEIAVSGTIHASVTIPEASATLLLAVPGLLALGAIGVGRRRRASVQRR